MIAHPAPAYRYAYGAGLASGLSLNDVQTLVAALGGDSAVGAIYDTRFNVNNDGSGHVTSWNDARGASGFGPTLVSQKGAGAFPAWDSVNKIITTDGSQNYLVSAVNSAFDVSQPRSLVFIATLPSGTYTTAAADAAVANYVPIYTGLADIKLNGSNGPTVLTAVPPGASRRLTLVSVWPKNYFGSGVIPAGGAGSIYVYGACGAEQQYLEDFATLASGGYEYWIGQLGGNYSPTAVRAAIWLNRVATGADLALIAAWANANHPFVEVTTNTRRIVFDGNSLTSGVGASQGSTDYPFQLMGSTGFTTNFDWTNLGVPSRTGTTQVLGFATRCAPLFQSSQAKKVYVCWEITNDLVAGVSAAQAVANVQACCQAAKAAGATACIALTCLPRVDFGTSGPLETARQTANAALKALPSGIDAVADVASIPSLSDYTNTSFYFTDEIHLVAAGYALVATDATNGVAHALAPYI